MSYDKVKEIVFSRMKNLDEKKKKAEAEKNLHDLVKFNFAFTLLINIALEVAMLEQAELLALREKANSK